MPIPPAVRMSSGAVVVPLAWSIAPPLVSSLVLPEVTLRPKDELHLTLLSSTEARALDAALGRPEAWRQLHDEDPLDPSTLALDGPWWLLRADKPEGTAWSVVAMARCAAFLRLRTRAAQASRDAIAADAPAHVTLFVAGDKRGIGLPSRAVFEAARVRRLWQANVPTAH